jgi:hypothetical protein
LLDQLQTTLAVRIELGSDRITVKGSGVVGGLVQGMEIQRDSVRQVRRLRWGDIADWHLDTKAKDFVKWVRKGENGRRRHLWNWVEISWQAGAGGLQRHELFVFMEFRRVLWDRESGMQFAEREAARFCQALKGIRGTPTGGNPRDTDRDSE